MFLQIIQLVRAVSTPSSSFSALSILLVLIIEIYVCGQSLDEVSRAHNFHKFGNKCKQLSIVLLYRYRVLEYVKPEKTIKSVNAITSKGKGENSASNTHGVVSLYIFDIIYYYSTGTVSYRKLHYRYGTDSNASKEE